MADQRTWGGRFGTKPDELMTRINASIGFDKRLWREDIAASKAHAAMLRDRSIISEDDAQAILDGLDKIAVEYEREGVPERVELEDIHMTVEHRLGELIGPAAGRLHTARSRNDQVATDFKLWVRNACDEAMSSRHSLLSKPIDALMRVISSAGFVSKRPPQVLCAGGFSTIAARVPRTTQWVKYPGRNGDPNGTRTRVFAVKGRRPRPLDDGAAPKKR